MLMSGSRRFAVLLMVVMWHTGMQFVSAADVNAVEETLTNAVDVQFRETPLSDVLNMLTRANNLPVVMDRLPLRKAGITVETIRVTESFQNAPLMDVLDQVLQPHKLEWITRHDVLLITTKEAALANYYDTRVYKMTRRVPVERRMRSIVWNIDPDSWATSGGMGDAAGVPPRLLLVYQSAVRHRKISQAFASSVALVRTPQGKPDGSSSLETKLQSAAVLDFENVPLSSVLKRLGERLAIDIRMDDESLDAAGLQVAGTPVTLRPGNVRSLASGLSLLVESLHSDLDWIVVDGDVVITTTNAAMNNLTKVSYEIKDIASGEEKVRRLMEALEYTVAPQTWQAVGGEGVLEVNEQNTSLTILQSAPVHRLLRRVFADLASGNAVERD